MVAPLVRVVKDCNVPPSAMYVPSKHLMRKAVGAIDGAYSSVKVVLLEMTDVMAQLNPGGAEARYKLTVSLYKSTLPLPMSMNFHG
jgi:hypothetical protein